MKIVKLIINRLLGRERIDTEKKKVEQPKEPIPVPKPVREKK